VASSTVSEESAQPTLTQKAVAGTAWSALSTAGRQILSIASVATVARLLGPGAYGVMAMANLLLVLVGTLRDLGTGTAIIQRANVSDRLLSSLLWVNFLMGLAAAALVIGSAPLMANFFHTPLLFPILAVLSISFWLTSSGIVHNSLLFREMQYKKLAIADLSSAILSYLTALICAYAGYGVWSLVLANIANSLSTTLLYWIFCRWRPHLVFDRKEVRSVLGFSLNLSGFVLVNYFSRNADNIIVGRVRGQSELGDYQMAYNLMLTPLANISAIIAQVTFPAFSRIQDDNSRFRSAFVRQSMLVGLITFPMMAGMGILADPMIRAVLGSRWTGAIPIFQILAPVGLVQSVVTLVGQIYTAKARTDLMFRWGVATSVILVLAFLVGVRQGAVGVALAYAIVYLAVIVYPTFYLPFRLIDLRVHDFARALFPQILVTLIMSLVCFGWLHVQDILQITHAWTRLLSTSLLGALVYIGIMIVFRPSVMSVFEEIVSGFNNPRVAKTVTFVRRLAWARFAQHPEFIVK
jgi:PST family polysaccharide transporter